MFPRRLRYSFTDSMRGLGTRLGKGGRGRVILSMMRRTPLFKKGKVHSSANILAALSLPVPMVVSFPDLCHGFSLSLTALHSHSRPGPLSYGVI